MRNNGLIDQKPSFSLACCFSRPVRCHAAAPVAYKLSITAATVYKGITGYIDCRAALARLLQEVAAWLPVHALFRVPAPPQPANADGTCQSAQGSPKHASMPHCDDQSSPRP